MTSFESLVLHTTLKPVVETRYKAPSYRQIIGVAYAGRSLWLPGVSQLSSTPEAHDVPDVLAGNIVGCFERCFISDPEAERNCHIGAAAMAGVLQSDTRPAYNHAIEIIERGIIANDLAIGKWGVVGEVLPFESEDDEEWYGEAYGPGAEAYHSVVGLAPGLAIQIDTEQGPLSLIDHEENLQQFRTARENAQLFRQQ